MKLVIAIIFALACQMAVADDAKKLCPDTTKYWNGTQCVACTAPCTECIFNNGKESCINCGSNTGKFLKGDGTCGNCFANCQACRGEGAGDCTSPNVDFTVSPSNVSKCAGINGCKWCSAENKCGKCKYGFRLANDTCTACQDANCADCSDAVANCKKCAYRTFLSGTTCQSCDAGCTTCPCKDCVPGFRFENAGCQPCKLLGCTKCQANISDCTECSAGFYYNKTLPSCVKCDDPNCATCTGTGQCSSCNAGFALKDNKQCVKCPDNCKTCSADGTCSECNHNFFASSDKKTCTACPAGCDGCNANGECTKCQANTFARSDKKGCDPCLAGCKDCTDDKSCKTCLPEYNLINSGTACRLWSACEVGQQQDVNGTCSAGTIDNCKYGINATADCYQCTNGYYPSSKKCVACPSGCEKCHADDKGRVLCDQLAQPGFSIVSNNNDKDSTGYLGKSFVATVTKDNKPNTCMPYAIQASYTKTPLAVDCLDYDKCANLQKGAQDWTCVIEGANAARVTLSLFAVLVAAIFTL